MPEHFKLMRKKYRSSHQTCSVKTSVCRNFVKFTGKHLYQSLFFIKVADFRPATLLKKRLWYKYFPVNFAKFLRTLFLKQNKCGRLLQKVKHSNVFHAYVYLGDNIRKNYNKIKCSLHFFSKEL